MATIGSVSNVNNVNGFINALKKVYKNTGAGLEVLPFAYLRTKCGLNTAKNKVSGNWRMTFEFIDGNAYVLDYEDYH